MRNVQPLNDLPSNAISSTETWPSRCVHAWLTASKCALFSTSGTNTTEGGGGGGGYPGGGGGYPRGGGGGQSEPKEDGKKILTQLSAETGGRIFEVSKKETVDQIYAQIEDELRHQYNLGYTPDRGSGIESGYHKIQLAVKKKDLVAQTRAGYYGTD